MGASISRMPKSKDDDVQKALLTAADSVVGSAIFIILGIIGGNYLDQLWHTTPLLAIILALVGGALGLIRLVIKANKL